MSDLQNRVARAIQAVEIPETIARPIIFSAPMVRALLDGRKTQTRRVLKRQPPEAPDPSCAPSNTPRHAAPYLDAYCGEKRTPANPRGMSRDWHWWQVDDRPGVCVTRAPCAPGDRLWVREAHTITTDERNAVYRVDATDTHGWRWSTITPGDPQREVKWRPSIHMPRWASRLTLTVTDVRVHRLQEISEGDVYAEGAMERPTGPRLGSEVTARDNARNSFADLWNSLHGPDAWAANPWVVALTFDVHRGNIDQMGGQDK